MWTVLYAVLRLIAPFHSTISWILTVWFAVAAIAAAIMGHYHITIGAAVLVLLLQITRTRFALWIASVKSRIENRS